MKNLIARICVLTFVIANSITMEAKDIKLPAPALSGGTPFNQAVANRCSHRDFDPSRKIEDAVLGQLLWSAVGINRPDAPAGTHGAPADRTNPTALNWQEIRAYVFRTDGVFEYIPASHSLRLIKEGDRRALLAGTAEFSQDFVNDAPCAVLFVADMTNLPADDQVLAMVHVDAGIACQNLNLACAALGVATVPRATMDTAAISTLLGLTPRRLPILNNPVGYAR